MAVRGSEHAKRSQLGTTRQNDSYSNNVDPHPGIRSTRDWPETNHGSDAHNTCNESKRHGCLASSIVLVNREAHVVVAIVGRGDAACPDSGDIVRVRIRRIACFDKSTIAENKHGEDGSNSQHDCWKEYHLSMRHGTVRIK